MIIGKQERMYCIVVAFIMTMKNGGKMKKNRDAMHCVSTV